MCRRDRYPVATFANDTDITWPNDVVATEPISDEIALSCTLTFELISSFPFTSVSPLSVSTLNFSTDPSVIEKSWSRPPVRTKLPVPLGLNFISTSVSVPTDAIVPSLVIWSCLSAAPIVTVSFTASILNYGTDSARFWSTTKSVDRSNPVALILPRWVPEILNPISSAAAL